MASTGAPLQVREGGRGQTGAGVGGEAGVAQGAWECARKGPTRPLPCQPQGAPPKGTEGGAS